MPTLLIDGRPLTEVAGILFYLARRFPEAGLLTADDIEAEAQVVSLDVVHRLDVHPARRQGAGARARRLSQLPTAARRRTNGRWAILDRRHPLFRLFWRFRGSLNPAAGRSSRACSRRTTRG